MKTVSEVVESGHKYFWVYVEHIFARADPNEPWEMAAYYNDDNIQGFVRTGYSTGLCPLEYWADNLAVPIIKPTEIIT